MVRQRHNDLHTQWSDIEACTTPERNNGELVTETESCQIQESPILRLEDEENLRGSSPILWAPTKHTSICVLVSAILLSQHKNAPNAACPALLKSTSKIIIKSTIKSTKNGQLPKRLPSSWGLLWVLQRLIWVN